MDKELVAHIVELVKMELRNSADVASSATGMLRLELVVHQCLMEMGRQVVQDLAQQAGTGYQGRRVKRGKVVFRFKGIAPRRCTGCMGRSRWSAPTTMPAVAERRGCRWMSSWGSETGRPPPASTIWPSSRARDHIKGCRSQIDQSGGTSVLRFDNVIWN